MLPHPDCPPIRSCITAQICHLIFQWTLSRALSSMIFFLPDVALFHQDNLLPNNSGFATIDSDGLFCLTPGNASDGNWFLPGSSVPLIDDVDAISSDQVSQ